MGSVPILRELHDLREQLAVERLDFESANEAAIEALRELELSRERYADLFNNAPLGYLLLDRNGFIREANRTAALMLGEPADRLCNVLLAHFVAKEDRRSLLRHLNRCRHSASDEEVTTGLRMAGAEGRLLDVALTSRTQPGMPKSLAQVRYRTAMVDVTDRKRAEAQVRADVAALTRMHDLSVASLGGLGLGPLLQEVMNTAVAIVGAGRGTLQLLEGGSLSMAAQSGHEQPFLEFFGRAENRASSCGEALRCRERVMVPDVEASPLFAGTPSLDVLRKAGVRAVQSTPMVSASGNLLGILTTHWSEPHSVNEHDLWRLDLLARQAADLIESGRARQALRESEEKYRSVVERASDGICVIQQGRLSYVNQRLAEMVQHKPEELVGREFIDYVCPDDRTMALDQYRRRLAGETSSYEVRLIGHDGDEVLVEVNAALAMYGGEQADIVLVRDVTERRQAERRLLETLAELKRSNEELEQFAYVASHDLQEPLRMVSNYVDLLRRRYRTKLDGQADKYIDYAAGGAKRMQALITDLLTFSRAGRREWQTTRVDLNQVFQRALCNLEAAIGEAGAEVTSSTLPTVAGDELALVQLFQNLIDNGIKFRSKEPPAVRVEAETRGRGDAETRGHGDAETGFVTIRVSDNGIGIEPRHAERVFRLFQRLHTAEEYPGTGIGLAVCKRIVERHGGRIWVESGSGKGTTFSFTLPGGELNAGQHPPSRES